MNEKRTRTTRHSIGDELTEARAEITRLKADNQRHRDALASAKAGNNLILTVVNELKDRLAQMFPTL